MRFADNFLQKQQKQREAAFAQVGAAVPEGPSKS